MPAGSADFYTNINPTMISMRGSAEYPPLQITCSGNGRKIDLLRVMTIQVLTYTSTYTYFTYCYIPAIAGGVAEK